MSKLMSLDKQVEEKAKKWFLNEQTPENIAIAKKFFEENKDEIKEEYLKKHPRVKKEYYEKKKVLFKVKIALATTGLVATTLAAGAVYHAKTTNEPIVKEGIKIEQEQKIDDMELIEETEQEDVYEKFFEEAKKIENTDKREEYITNYTKQIIVEKYNKANPDNQITVDRLETLILNETVRKNTDRLGNHTYERVSQNAVGEDLVKIGGIYDFRIDGKTVAVFDNNGDVLPDKNVEKHDMSFKEAITLINQSEKLKDIYRYRSNDYEKGKVEKSYQKVADEYSKDMQQIDIEKNER